MWTRPPFLHLLLVGLAVCGCQGSAANDECTGFASGSLSDGATVPGSRDTALGVTLEFQAVTDDELEMSFVCSSNGEVLHSGPVAQSPGFAFMVEVEGEPHRIEFAWVAATDIEFSLAVLAL